MAENKFKISIITACYNSENYIEQTILSVINQTYSNIEYIIVDGSSTDRTMEIVKKYRNKIDIIISEPDEGIYDAFNKGLKKSTGDIIYFLNSDDYIVDKSTIKKVADVFVNKPSIKIVYGNIIMKNESIEFFRIFGEPFSIRNIKQGIMPPHPGMFVRKELFEEFKGFDTNYDIASDLDFVIKAFNKYESQSYYLDSLINVFRYGGISSDIAYKEKLYKEKNVIISKHFGINYKKIMSNSDINITYYKKWLELLLIKDKTLSSSLKARDINTVAIFGSMEISLYVLKDLQKSDINTLVFLDNDTKRHGYRMQGVKIVSPNWLLENVSNVDAIILSFEGNYGNEVKEQIRKLEGCSEVNIYSWKEMIEQSL